MTADGTAGDRTAVRGASGPPRSVRVRALVAAVRARIAPPTAALLVLVVLAWLIHGFRALGAEWVGGDLLYHQALAREALRATIPPEGPYAGLPSWYPPGFHLLLAATMAVTGLDAVGADSILTFLWIPVLPVGTFLLARRITGRPWVAVLAAALTLFAGGYDLRAGRIWVNALFISGQAAWPLYPRDVVFGLLPFAVLAFLRALDEPRARPAAAWGAVTGALIGIASLVQAQLLVPLPAALLVAAIVGARRAPGRWARTGLALAVTGGVALVIVAPWLAGQVSAIRQNGGVALDSSEALEPARFGLWQYPREFGLVLPLAVLGAGVALLFLRRPDGPRLGGAAPGRWRSAPVGAALVVAWATVAFALGILYSPDWPLEDALRPQRMWLVASQPLAILAAIGLVALAEEVVEHRWTRPRLVTPAIMAATLLATVPATAATARLLSLTWTHPTYAHLDLRIDRVPDFGALVGGPGPRRTILAHEDWSSLIWYLTGHGVVGVHPAGFAKLAFDPGRFTELDQAGRRATLLDAYDGAIDDLVAVAERTGASAIVVARSEAGQWALFDAAAVPASRRPAAVEGPALAVEGNGWDGLLIEPGSRLVLPTDLPAGAVRVEVRFADHPSLAGSWAVRLASRTSAGDRPLARLAAVREPDGFSVAVADLTLPAGASLLLEAEERLLLQSVRGFAPPPAVPGGWRLVHESAEGIVLERAA